MTLAMFINISPLLLIAFGITLALLLIAWQRSQKMIALFTKVVLIFALVLNMNLLSIEPTSVTMLLKVDSYSSFTFSLICLSALLVVQLSERFLKSQVEVHDEYYLLLLLVVLGAGILVTSDHFASLFLGFELLSISLSGLVGYMREHKYAVETGFKYLILSATASSFMLLGIAFLYSQTGDLSFTAEVVQQINNGNVISAQGAKIFTAIGVLLLFSGMAFKLSLVPFHFWTPDIYQGAPTPITLLMATVSKIAMLTVLMKCCFAQGYFSQEHFVQLVFTIAILSMLVGNALALKQQNIKRLLGYSSIAHFGYLLIVLVVSSAQGVAFAWQSGLFYLTAYVLASLSLFTVIYLLEMQLMSKRKCDEVELVIDDFQGMFWQKPLMALLVIVAVLSFAGIPLTMGFIGKFYLLNQAVLSHAWLLIAALIVGSGIGLAYYLPLIFTLFKEQKHPESEQFIEGDLVIKTESLIVFTLLVGGVLFGIFPDIVSQFIHA